MTLLIFYASFLCSKMSALVFKMENPSVTCYLNTTNDYLISITCWGHVQHAQVLSSKQFLSFICVPEKPFNFAALNFSVSPFEVCTDLEICIKLDTIVEGWIVILSLL